ncbi:hypothetical protein AB0A70_00495 [Streptomyces morookaense]|uniref:hypothetical protein n=1 Tax=Streptomyces morookaense TaxID=1970 RepID=UPI0033E3AF17
MTHNAAVHETVAALRTIRETWAELLLAIETPPADVWPPRQLAHTMRANDELLVEDRAPLVLREHPAPLNLRALDIGLDIEQQVFDLADRLAIVQHAAPGDPRRWDYRSPTSPGSRAHGVHWACVWIEGRVLDEDTTPEQQPDGTFAAAPFDVLPPHLLHEARRVARACEGRLLRLLGLDQRNIPIPDRSCPWCGGELTLHTEPEQAPTVSCSTGPACTAPVSLDAYERRVWGWGELPTLLEALVTAPKGGTAQAA